MNDYNDYLAICPCCGGEPMFIPTTYNCQLECFKCGLKTRVHKNKNDAIKSWNKRDYYKVKKYIEDRIEQCEHDLQELLDKGHIRSSQYAHTFGAMEELKDLRDLIHD